MNTHEINLLRSLIQETDFLNFTAGANKKSPVLIMDGSHGVFVNGTGLTFQKNLHEHSCSGRKEFVIRACVKFNGLAANGPIIFLHSNNTTYLSMEIDSGNIKVSFVHDREMRAVSFPFTFTDLTSWHNISVIFNGRIISLYVNCEKVDDQVVMEPLYCLPDDIQLYIGDNPLHTQTFQVCTLITSSRSSVKHTY